MQEIWREIPNTCGCYKVSSLGSVKSFKCRNGNGRLLRPSNTGTGYLKVGLFLKDGRKTITIHKLMQMSFELGEGICDHIDGNTYNNTLENLRIGTYRDNNSNRKCHRDGKLVGASWCALYKKWESRIMINGKQIRVGRYETELLAHEAYLKRLQLCR